MLLKYGLCVRLVRDAIGRVDPNMILLIVRVVRTIPGIQDGRVPDKREVVMYENIHCSLLMIAFISGFH